MSRIPLSKQIMNDLEFEIGFYAYIAESDKFDVVPVPYEDGYVITSEDYQKMMAEAEAEGITILFRLQNGKTAIVINSKTGKQGIVPENNVHGFEC